LQNACIIFVELNTQKIEKNVNFGNFKTTTIISLVWTIKLCVCHTSTLNDPVCSILSGYVQPRRV